MTTTLIVAGIVLLILGVSGAIAIEVETKTGRDAWDHLFWTYSTNPTIAKAICAVESNYNPDAVGDAGRAHGLMQIWMATAEGYGFSGNSADLMRPENNIKYASKFLDDMIAKYGVDRGIMAYNLGETKIRKGYTVEAYLDKVYNALSA